MKTVTEKYRAIKSGQITEAEFVRQMRLTHPEHITQFNGFADTIQILKNKGLLFEEKEYVTVNLSDDSIRRGLRYELQAMNLDPAGKVTSEELDKAKQKATANIKKDPLHYYNLLSGESSKVDKHDKEVEVKKGNHKDTHNGLKKADLKEEVIAEGTRALVGYLAGDRLTTAYNHYDGYPSHLGKALEMHYNNDEAAKDLALKGYISSMDADTGEIKATHNDPPKKIKLPEDDEEMAREVAEQIDGMGADYGYIWDDRANRWVTIKNTGIRSMIDQVMDKMGDYGEMEEEVVEVDSTLDPYEDKKIIIQQVIDLLKTEKRAGNEVIKDFIKTHYEDIINLRDDQAILDEFEEFLSVNTDYVDETDAYDSDDDTQDMIDKMRKDGKDSDDFVDEKKLNEEGAEDANYKMGEAFKKYGIDLSRDVIVAEMDGGTPQYGGGQVDIGPPEPAMLVAKRLERHRLDTILDYESEDQMRDFPVMYEDGFYGDYTPEGTEHKLTYSEDEGTMWDIFQAPSGVSEKKGKDHDGDGDIDGDDYMAAKDKAIKKATGKDVNEALTVSGNSEEEIKKNAEELLALAKKVGLDKAEIKYSDNGNVHGVELNDKVEDRNAGKTRKVSDLQDKQYQAAKAARPKDGKPSFKAKKLKKLTVGGKTYEKGESDPNDDGRIMSIEKYPNGYFISGGVYSDYGDGDGPKEGYGYAIDLKGKEMDEEDLEGMYEGKKPASKKPNVNEAVKNIIQKVLEEQVLNEAATQELAKIADEYDSFDGLKPAVIALENVVTEIESFYDKTRAKIQKIYNDLGEVKNEEGLKVGAFITPSIENAFKRDLRPIIKNQFHGGLEMPKVKRISQADVDKGYIQQEAPKQTVYSPVNENVDIKGIKKKVKGPEAGAIFKKAQELLDNGDAEGMRDALNNAATAYYMVYSQDDNEYGIKVAKYIMRSTDKPGTKHRTVTPGKEKKAKKQSFDINGIRNAVEGPEANAIFKTAKKYLKDRDAKDMRDALDMAADEYYEFYDRKDNEDGKEVAKYIMSSLRK